MKLKTAVLLALCLLAAPWAARAQDPPAPDPTDATALIDALLGTLGGFAETTPADLQRDVAEVGGVPFRRDVPLDYMSKADLTRYLRELFDSEYPPEKARADERMLVAFGLLAEGDNLRAIRAKLLEDNVVGFYDERPDRRRLYAVSSNKRLTPANQIILAHELRHALQDQYMDLHRSLPDTVGDFDDRRMALMSLVEGDATLVMEKFLTRRLGIDSGTLGNMDLGSMALPAGMGLPDTAPVLRDQLLVPYLSGRQFVYALWQKGGWAGVRAAWDRPPFSTEQVLHPEKYLAGEPASMPALTLAPKGGTVVSDGVLGELFIRTLLGEGGEAGAAGWAGDHFKMWDLSGRSLLVWRSVWDSDAERAEFLAAARRRLAAGDAAPTARGAFSVFTRGKWRVALGEVDGGVVYVSADDASVLNTALDELARR